MAEPLDRLFEALADRYTVEREVGAGGMATVYLAHDVRHDRKVALKVLRPELAAVMGGERFLGEIRTTANLQHPHILPLFDSGEAAGFLYYVMPFIDGDTLRERLEREKQLPVEEAIAITVKVAGALQAAHDKGIVHRDIKPANILLANGEPLVSDFGIALAVQHAGAGRLTETGLSLGTPYYMSPEQATADRDPDARSDVYSLACVLYEMLAGEPPFQGSTAQAVLGRILTQTAPSISGVRASVPAHIDAVLGKALEKLPADRVDSAADFSAALVDPAKAALLAPRPQAEVSGVAEGSTGGLIGRVVPWAVAAVGVVVGLVSAFDAPEVTPPMPIRFSLGETPVTAQARHTMAVTPDGSQVVFVGRFGGTEQLLRRSMTSPDVVPIPQTEGAEGPEISPDGRWVAFTTPEGIVRRVRLDGGAPVTIAEPPREPIGMSWVSDERILFGMLRFSSEYPGVTAVDIGNREIQTVTLAPRGEDTPFAMHHEPHALPGGTHALIIDIQNGRRLSRIALANGTTERLVLRGPAIRGGNSIVGVADGVLLYIGQGNQLHAVRWDEEALEPVGDAVTVPGVQGNLLEADVARDGTLALRFGAESYRVALLDDRGELLDVVAPEWFNFRLPRISPDGSTLALYGARVPGPGELWVYDFDSGLLSQLSMGFSPGALDWTPEGTRLVAIQSVFGDGAVENQVWSRAANASDEPSLMARYPTGVVEGLSVAPDGRTLAFARDALEDRGVERMNVEVASMADTIATPFAAGEADELAPRFSPDGRWLAYSSSESGRPQVYVRPYPGPGARVQVSDEGGWQPLWSRDGGTVFYRIGPAVVAATLSVDGERLRVVGRERLFEGDFLGGPSDPSAAWDVHPDGDRFLLAQGVGGSTGRIIVWRDWLHEVHRLLAAEN